MNYRSTVVVAASFVCIAGLSTCSGKSSTPAAQPSVKKDVATLTWFAHLDDREQIAKAFVATLGELTHHRYAITTGNVALSPDKTKLVVDRLVLSAKRVRVELHRVVLTAVDRQRVRVVVTVNNNGTKNTVEAMLSAGKGNLEISVEDKNAFGLQAVPGLRAAVGLPVAGTVDADIKLELPKGKWNIAAGKIDLNCPNCTVTTPPAKP